MSTFPPPTLNRAECQVCGQPIRIPATGKPATGRPRRYCSAKCRQRYFRARRQFADPGGMAAKHAASSWRKVKRLERQYGPYNDTPGPDGSPSRRWRVYFYVSRSMPLRDCVECRRPFAPAYARGSSLNYCSPLCESRAARRRRVARQEIYQRGRPLDHRVIAKLVARQPFSICQHCQKPFVRAEAGRPALYCSLACRQAAYYQRQHPPVLRHAFCDGCGETFAVTHPNQKYCSERCQDRMGHRRRSPRRYWDYCQFCGAHLPRLIKPGPAPMYCSPTCRSRAHLLATRGFAKRHKYCFECGATLPDETYRPSQARKYCSRRCGNRAAARRYRQRLKSALPASLPFALA